MRIRVREGDRIIGYVSREQARTMRDTGDWYFADNSRELRMQKKIPVYAASGKKIREISITRACSGIKGGILVDMSPLSERRKGYVTAVMQVPHPLRSGQAQAYERYGAEKHRQVLSGGLTRTETQPNPKPSILSWGHIGEKPSRTPYPEFQLQREPRD